MTLRQQQSFSSNAFYVHIAVIVTSATPLSGAPLITRRSLMRPVVRFPVAGLDAIRAHIATPGGHITVQSKYTCVSENVVYAIKCRTCNKLYIGETGRSLGDRFREHLRSTRLSGTDLPVGRHFTSPGRSIGHSVRDAFWLQTSDRKAPF